MMRTSGGGGRMGGPITQPRSLRPVQVQDSPSTKLVPGPVSARINHETTGQRRVHGLMTEGRPPVPPPAESYGTPKGFWDQQVSSRGIGKDSTQVDGREKVTHMYHQVQNEVKMLRRREGAMASELVCKAPDVDEDAQAIEDRRRIRELFQTIDTDGSGVLEKDEVTELMLKLGTPGLNEEMVDQVMLEMDRDGGGDVQIEEFMQWWEHTGSKMGGKMQAMMENATNRRFILDCPLFNSLGEPEFIDVLAGVIQPKSYKKGEYVTRKGDVGDCMFFVKNGSAVALLEPEENAMAAGTLGPGSYFGEHCMVREGERRNAYVRAFTDELDLMVLTKADLLKALDSYHAGRMLKDMLFTPTGNPLAEKPLVDHTHDKDYQPSWTAPQPVDPRQREPQDPKPSWFHCQENHFDASAAMAMPPDKSEITLPATRIMPEQHFAPCSPRRRNLTPRDSATPPNRRQQPAASAYGGREQVIDGRPNHMQGLDQNAAALQLDTARADHRVIGHKPEAPWASSASVSGRKNAMFEDWGAERNRRQRNEVPRVGGPASSWAARPGYIKATPLPLTRGTSGWQQ